jgi:hypothetical protein
MQGCERRAGFCAGAWLRVDFQSAAPAPEPTGFSRWSFSFIVSVGLRGRTELTEHASDHRENKHNCCDDKGPEDRYLRYRIGSCECFA